MKKINRKTYTLHKQIHRYLISYVIILLIPCLLASYTYKTFYQELAGDIDEVIITRAEIISNDIDGSLERMYHFFYMIDNSREYHAFQNTKSNYDALLLVQELKLYSESTDYIFDYGYIDYAEKMIYTPKGSYHQDAYVKSILNMDSVGENENLLYTDGTYSFLVDDNIIYIHNSIMFNRWNDVSAGAFFYVLNTAEIEEEISPLFPSDNEVRFIHSSQFTDSNGGYSVLAQKAGCVIAVNNGSNSINARLTHKTKTFNLMMTFTLLLSVILSVIMSREHMRPINRLLDLVKPYRLTNHFPANRNEIRQIYGIIEDILDVNGWMSEKIDEQKNIVRQHTLFMLFSGNIDGNVIETLNNVGIVTSGGYWFVLSVRSVESVGAQINDRILNIIEDILLPAAIELYPTEIYENNAIVVLVRMSEKQEGSRENIGNIVYEYIRENNIEASVNAGEIVGELKQVSLSYQEAMFIESCGVGVCLYDSSNKLSLWNRMESAAYKKLEQMLDNGICFDIPSAVEELLGEIDVKTSSALTRRCAYSEALGNLLKYNTDAINADEIAIVDILSRNSIKEMLVKIVSRLSQTQTKIERKEKDDGKYEEIVAFVRSNFASSNLCIDMLVSKFNVSANQVTHVFKTKTGYGFREYLIFLRMREARQKLLTTDMKIEDIAHASGYETPSYFIKTFKSYYGVTPAQYKKISTELVPEQR